MLGSILGLQSRFQGQAASRISKFKSETSQVLILQGGFEPSGTCNIWWVWGVDSLVNTKALLSDVNYSVLH